MGRRRMAGRLLTMIAACAALAAVPAAARADAAAGGQLAQRWCASCHAIGGDSPPPASLQQGPPTFRSIADSGKTRDQLSTFLTRPHGQMPDLALSRAEIDDLVDYIETLR